MVEFLLSVIVILIVFYAHQAWCDYLFGVRWRRKGPFLPSGWSVWAQMGWNAEDRRLRRRR